MGKKIAIDTSILIYLLEKHPRYFLSAKRLLSRVQKGDVTAVFSIIGMIEILTGVKQKGRDDLANSYRQLFGNFPHFDIYTLTEQTVEIASDLRARYQLKTPDAIHLATAIEHQAKIFYTNDKALEKVTEIRVQRIEKL